MAISEFMSQVGSEAMNTIAILEDLLAQKKVDKASINLVIKRLRTQVTSMANPKIF